MRIARYDPKGRMFLTESSDYSRKKVGHDIDHDSWGVILGMLLSFGTQERTSIGIVGCHICRVRKHGTSRKLLRTFHKRLGAEAMSVAKVLIVDDHQVVVEGIKAALSEYADVEVVGQATDGRKAFNQVESLKPDIVIMDLAMPHFNGIEATYQIKQMDPKIKVIMFTIYPYREFIRPLIKSGISGYVLKGSPISDLYLAIQVVRRGGSYFTEDIHDFLSNLGNEEQEPFDLLSPREREVFQLLAEGLSVKEVGERLYISSKTVETHKYHIMSKLQIQSMNELIKEAIRMKIVISPNCV